VASDLSTGLHICARRRGNPGLDAAAALAPANTPPVTLVSAKELRWNLLGVAKQKPRRDAEFILIVVDLRLTGAPEADEPSDDGSPLATSECPDAVALLNR